MNKHHITISIVLLALMYAIPCFAFPNEPEGFRGNKWGANKNSFKSLQKDGARESFTDDVAYYVNSNEILNIGEIKVNSIEYAFYDINGDELFAAAMIKFGGHDEFQVPHSMSKCNSVYFCWSFIAQTFPGSVVNT